MTINRSRTLLLALAASVTPLLVACSDDADTASAANCTDPAGSTIKVMSILEEAPAMNVLQTSARAGLDAKVAAINCAGGLGKAGHKVEVEYCLSQYDPNAVNACANKAVDDESIVATVSGGVSVGAPGSILAEGGVPNIPQTAYASDLESGTTFAAAPSGVQLGPGEPVMGCMLGHEKQSLLLIQSPSAAGVTEYDNQALASYGCPELLRTVNVPLTATDLSSQVVAAADGADAIVLAVAPAQAISAFRAAQQLGIDIPIISNVGTMTADTIKAAGPAAEGVLVEAQAYRPTDTSAAPGYQQFLDDMAAIGKSDLSDGWAQGSWISADLFAAAAKDLETVDRSSLLAALSSLTSYDAGGQIPTIDFTAPVPNPALPRLFNDKFSPAIVENGEIVAMDEDEIDPFIAIEKVD